jgi:SAM-dependent methyltransferase
VSIGNGLRALARMALPISTRRRLGTAVTRLTRFPPVGAVEFGDLRRTTPISQDWGFDRGTPIDRYYIERFLELHSLSIRSRVVEVGDDTYTLRFGGQRVTSTDVLHVSPDFPGATIIGDLTDPDSVPAGRFDCIIVTQTLNFIFDVSAAVATLHRMLAPGGILLATVPGISKLSREDMDRWGEYWSFTSRSIGRLFDPLFGPENVNIEVYGNVLAATSFLQGLSSEELTREELDFKDPDYETLIGVAASLRGGTT